MSGAIRADSVRLALYVHRMGQNVRYDCVAWSNGVHTTKRRAWATAGRQVPAPDAAAAGTGLHFNWPAPVCRICLGKTTLPLTVRDHWGNPTRIDARCPVCEGTGKPKEEPHA